MVWGGATFDAIRRIRQMQNARSWSRTSVERGRKLADADARAYYGQIGRIDWVPRFHEEPVCFFHEAGLLP